MKKVKQTEQNLNSNKMEVPKINDEGLLFSGVAQD